MYTLAEDDPDFIIEAIPPLAPGAARLFDLASSPAAAVFAVLEREPAALVAQILAARQWEWREDVLLMCSRERREAIAAAPLEHAPALLAYALRTLAARLA